MSRSAHGGVFCGQRAVGEKIKTLRLGIFLKTIRYSTSLTRLVHVVAHIRPENIVPAACSPADNQSPKSIIFSSSLNQDSGKTFGLRAWLNIDWAIGRLASRLHTWDPTIVPASMAQACDQAWIEKSVVKTDRSPFPFPSIFTDFSHKTTSK